MTNTSKIFDFLNKPGFFSKKVSTFVCFIQLFDFCFRCWGDHWANATGEEMDLNPHIPKVRKIGENHQESDTSSIKKNIRFWGEIPTRVDL